MAATIDQDLVAALKAARGGKPMRFAFVPKGTGGKLLVAKKVAPKEVAETKKEVGGAAVFQGRCVGENGTLVFEVAKEPPATLAAQLKRWIKEHAGLTWEVTVRVKGDAEEEGTADEPAAAPGAAPPAGREQVMARLQRLTPGIKAALAGPNAARVQALSGAVSGLVKNNDFAQAAKVLDELEPLVAPRTTPPPPPGTAPPPPPPPPPDAAKAAVVKRLGGLTGAIKAALAGPNAARVQALSGAVSGLVKNNDFAQAAKVLDELEPLVAPKAAPAPSADGAAARFAARLKALMPELKSVQAAGGATAEALKRHVGEAQGAAVRADFDKANAALGSAEGLVKQAMADAKARAEFEALLARLRPEALRCLKEQAGDTTKIRAILAFAEEKGEQGKFVAGRQSLRKLEPLLGAARQSADGAAGPRARYEALLERLTPDVERCLKEGLGDVSKIRAVHAFALERAGQENYRAALQSLKVVEGLVRAAPAAGPAGGERAGGLVGVAKGRLHWKAAQDKVAAQLAALRDTIPDEIDEADAPAVAKKLDVAAKRLEGFSERLIDALDESLNAAGDARGRALAGALSVTAEYLQYVEKDELLRHAVAHPFDSERVAVESELAEPLRRLAAQLKAAQA